MDFRQAGTRLIQETPEALTVAESSAESSAHEEPPPIIEVRLLH